MEGPDRDQRDNPQGMFMSSLDIMPFKDFLKEHANKIGIDKMAEMIAEQTGSDPTEEELAQFIEAMINNGAEIDYQDMEELPVEDEVSMLPEPKELDDNGHPDNPFVNVNEEEEDDSDDDFDWGDDEEEEDLDYDKIASYAKDKPVAHEPASDERVKSNKKPCAEEPKPEVASDEKCKENKKPCAEEDSTRFSDESLKNIIGVLADRIL